MIAKLSSGSLAKGDIWYNGKTKNPWDINQGSSGSSAGSASATSAGLVSFSIGTETLGSIISPSTRCGVTGLRPTYGTVSTNGFMTLSWSMDKVGPITRSASDAAIVFNVIKYKGSSKQRPLEFNSIKNLKIGYLKNLFEKDTSRYAVNNSKIIEILKNKYKLDSVSLPKDYPFKVFDIILRSEAGAFFDKFLMDNLDSEMVLQDEKSRANSIRQSRLIPAVEYIQASRFRTKLISEVDSLFKNYDVILSPSFGKNQLLITNLTGHPAISIPNGFDKNNRPTSISLLSNYYEEHKLISLANEIQKLTDFHKKIPPGFKE
jgi:Asp-tRNA(Asn)/Glu-tRNA(Gln) amidotransferase A subunit family amidase